MPPLKNTRHKKERLRELLQLFECYRRTSDIRECAIASCASPRRFYVYLLCDPFNGEVFYVGKGKGRRVFTHQRDARAKNGGLARGNPRKASRIIDILRAGGSVDTRILIDDLSEAEAYEIERAVIHELGPEKLTNHCAGIFTERELAKLRLKQIKPFDKWMAEKKRTQDDIEIYWGVVKVFQEMATCERHPGYRGGGWYGPYRPA